MRAPRHERTVPIVRSQPRQTQRIPLPRPRSLLKRCLWSPAVILACVVFLIGGLIATLGMMLVVGSDTCLHWIHGGDHAR